MKCYHCETQITPGIDKYRWGESPCGMPVPFHVGERWHADNCYETYKKKMQKERADAIIRSID